MSKILALLILTFTFNSFAETIGFDEENPPFMYGSGATSKGIYPALCKEAFKRMKVPLTVEGMPWKRILSNMDAGLMGIGGAYKTKERLLKYDYSNTLLTEKLVLVTLKNKKFKYNNVHDLKGKSVGVILGWSYGEAFDQASAKNEFSVDESRSDEVNFTKLSNNRIDVIIAISEAAQTIIKDKKLQTQMEILPVPLLENNSFVAFSKSAGKKALLTKFNQAITSMKNDGTFDRILKQTLHSP